MNTKKIFSTLVRTGARLAILASMLMTAFMGNVAGVAAAPAATLTQITLGAPSGSLTSGTAGSITYQVTVTKNNSNNNSSATLSLTWTGGTPTGVTTSFSPNPVSWGGSGGNRTSTLTINTTALTPAVVRNFTVRAQRNGSNSDFQTVVGTLTVGAPLLLPSITFGTAPTPTFPGANFTVSATTTSNGALTYSRVSGPCAFVSGASFSTSGTGTCVVQASTAATSTYTAGSAQQSVTITAGSGTAFDLYAVTGTTTLPGAVTTTVWGYNTSNAAVTKSGGPTLIVNQGDTVVVTLHNQLPAVNTALLFQGQSLIPDQTGAVAGGTKTYTFTASHPGTFLYEAGLIPGSQYQVAMGLYGALIVRPTGFTTVPGQAYGSSTTAFDSEQVLVLSELDLALNSSVNPAAFDIRNYSPKYYLINGKAYPSTDAISVDAGKKVLLRYVNAGLQAHAMSTLGLSQSLLGQDGSPYNYSHSVVAETIATGQTLDVIVSIPAGAIANTQYPLYDASLFLRNNTGKDGFAGIGGMLTTLNVGSATPPPPPPGDTTGPVASALGLSPNPTNGSVDIVVSANISDATTGGSNIDQAEFYIDTTAGSPIAMAGVFGSPTASVTGTIPVATLGILVSGNHTIYVRGHDSAGNWGGFLSTTLNLDKTGPATTGLQLSGFDLFATGDDTASGNNNVTAAEYWIDGGSHVTMTIVAGADAPIRSFTAAIPPAGLQGPHVVSVRSQDSFGNWGAPAAINLNATDPQAPTTSNISASPNPNNGAKPFNTTIQAVRVTADFSDVATGNSNIVAAEGFLNAAGAIGTGFAFIANDGNFNSPAESGYADIPLAVLEPITFGEGPHPICVHAKDASGNWGTVDCSYNLIIDRTAPTITSITRVGASPTNAPSVQFLVTFSESVTGVTAGNFTLIENLAGSTVITSVTGTGATRTVTTTTGMGTGTLGLNLTSPTGITDVAGNALPNTGLPYVGEVYQITPAVSGPLYFSTLGNSTVPGVGGTADDADIYFYNGTGFSRVIDASGTGSLGLPSSANVDGFDRVSATEFYMSFNGQVNVPGIGNVQDEDVVHYNAGTWSLFFDGSTHALTSNLDAISIVGGTLYFSLSTNTTPPGVTGPGGDDADIYRWNGDNTYTRIFDATALGWSGNNVDGFVYVDANHFYLSYEPSSTTVAPYLGTVQDEDVVYYDNGVWSVYFDGTNLGLTSNNNNTASNLDVDAFDIP